MVERTSTNLALTNCRKEHLEKTLSGDVLERQKSLQEVAVFVQQALNVCLNRSKDCCRDQFWACGLPKTEKISRVSKGEGRSRPKDQMSQSRGE